MLMYSVDSGLIPGATKFGVKLTNYYLVSGFSWGSLVVVSLACNVAFKPKFMVYAHR